jgi:excinuclease UvrABC helicase subunit UvrB
LLETEKNNNQGNLSKMINDSNVMRTNQSLIIEAPQPPPRETIKQVSEQVQTEETGNKSFMFMEARRQKMDQANFHKTIQQLNHQINHLSLELSSEDVVIDLTDLVNTKGTLSFT